MSSDLKALKTRSTSTVTSDGGRPKPSPSPWKSSKPAKAKKAPPGLSVLNGNWAYLFTAPFFIMFIIFGMIPVFYSVYIAFFHWDPLDPSAQVFAGLDNFRTLWADANFWNATRNTFSIWLLATVPQLVMALGLAAILRSPVLKAATFWRTLLLVPNITSVLAVAIVFGQLFGRDYGMINLVLGGLGFDHVDFFEQTLPGHIAIAVMIIWRWVGYNSLIFLAAMLAIPSELYESAEIDGANAWKQFRYVTLPQLRNTITFFLVVGTIGGLQVFAEPLTIGGATGGSSRQVQTLTLFLYEQAFVNVNWGYGAAVGIAITIIVLIISALNFALTRRLSSEDSR
jgi:cellobiose transport system permease protein